MKTFKITEKMEAVCEYQKTRSGFRHVAVLLINGTETSRTKVCYQNRTWESFEFETVLKKLLKDVMPEKELRDFITGLQNDEWKKVDSMFNTVATTAKLGNIIAETQEDRVKWKERMVKAGVPALSLPDNWNELSLADKELKLDKVIEFMERG